MSKASLKILYIGDVVGRGGRLAVRELVPKLRKELELDAVFMNAENLAHGRGITKETVESVLDAGIDWCSSGNHIWDNEQGVEYLKTKEAKVIRPANFAVNDPGNGWAEVTVGDYTILLVNVIGQVFMDQEVESPFTCMDAILANRPLQNYSAIIVDLHAEATSEKQGLAFYLDGRISALVGTHTHVPTADLRILPKGTGLVCDLGYVGSSESVLGFGTPGVLERFLNNTGKSLTPVESGPMDFKSVLIEVDLETKTTKCITRIDRLIKV